MPDLFWVGLRGIVIGFSIAMPVGPIGILCIRRTLLRGRWVGFLSGLGAATADAFYGSLAAFGITTITSLLVTQQNLLQLVGGVVLLVLGVRIFFSRPAEKSIPTSSENGFIAFFSTLLLTLTNPLTILSFAAIFLGLGLNASGGKFSQIAVLVLGVFTGSAAWWLFLSGLVGIFKERLKPRRLVWVNRISGIVVVAFGIAGLFQAGSNQSGKISSTLVVDLTPQTQSLVPQVNLTGFSRAAPGQTLTFPKDYGPHPDYQTEWWYYTGNLADNDGRRFGYQLTFFRRALLSPQARQPRASDWAVDQVYLAHFALTDVTVNRHDSFERVERGAGGIAGAQAAPFEVWLDDWSVMQDGTDQYKLHAEAQATGGDALRIDLTLKNMKNPVLQGVQGYSQKGPDPGNASYYYSFTRLESTGAIISGGRQYQVKGFSWMDHEYSTSALTPEQVGWDWFSIQMDDGSDLMVFQIRKKDGTVDPFSSGTFIAPDGSTISLHREDFIIEVLDTWKSKKSGGNYPSHWRVNVPSVNLVLEITPLVLDQEMNLTYTYWEGAVRLHGSRAGIPLEGYGFVELTGYSGSMAGEF